MNSRDRANLDFLMNTSAEDFDAWMQTASNDDIDYAMELIKRSKVELMVQQIELQDLMVEYEEDMADARLAIERIKNVGKI
jgi:hypothetical protein